MEPNVTNRMADTRKRGRPSSSDSLPVPPVEAMPVVLTAKHVPPLNCPRCGRGMVPRVERWVAGIANCTCGLCGRRFDYTPPSVRVPGGQ